MSAPLPTPLVALAQAAAKANAALKSQETRDLEATLAAIKAAQAAKLRRVSAAEAAAAAPHFQATRDLEIEVAALRAAHQRTAELKTNSDDGPSMAAAAAAAAAAPAAPAAAAAATGPDTDNKAKDLRVVTLFGFEVKLRKPRVLSAAELASLKEKVGALFDTLLEEIREQRTEVNEEEEVRECLSDLDGRLSYVEECAANRAAKRAAKRAARAESIAEMDDDADSGADSDDSSSDDEDEEDPDPEVFALADQICKHLEKHFRAAGCDFLPSVKFLWATFEKFGMTVDNERIRDDAGWDNDDERKAEFAFLLAAGPDADDIDADFPAVAAELERQAAKLQAKADAAKRKAKGDAKRAKGDKAAKRAKH
jgi:hypothetical protein